MRDVCSLIWLALIGLFRSRASLHAEILSNIGIGHGAIDAGGGYTYFNPQTGHELSGVLGFTYNFINTSTQYQNGVDLHFDWVHRNSCRGRSWLARGLCLHGAR